ncbi:MAG: hypothetical protein D3916_09550 [Candidatus Electrothrix sp. MAN1_4]|nr:hypothetical protein [Candidatus Electrothrix sp. MAN1_4]
MKKIVVGILIFAVALSASAGDWNTYRNEKYQYEIQYPDSWEVVEGGLKGKRDGRIISVRIKEYTAVHGVTVQVFPELSLDQFLSERNVPSLKELDKGPISKMTTFQKITWKKVIAHDAISVQMEVRGVDNDLLGMRLTFRDHVEFRADYTIATSNETLDQIIESFRWSNRVQQ